MSEEIQSVLLARECVYRLLQNVSGNDPHADMLEAIFADAIEEALHLFESEDQEAYGQAIERMVEQKQRYVSDKDAFLETARKDYATLYIGPHELKAPPWACVYLTNERVLFQESTLKVREAYRAQNMLPSQYPHVSDDHIAIELDFMGKLAEKTRTAYDEGDITEVRRLIQAQATFLDDHMLTWVSRYAADIQEIRPDSVHAAAMALCAAFIPLDRALLDELEQETTL